MRVLAAFCALFLPLAAQAADPFTPAQRQEIVSIVRDALKSDPSILRAAIGALQEDDAAKQAAEQKTAIVANRQALYADPADAVAGNPNGDVTLVEFYDPRCPYCRRVLPEIDELLQKDKNLRLVYKDIPVLGPPSELESRAIVAAQAQGGYLKMQTALMKNPAQPSVQMIKDTARSLGLDGDRLARDMMGDAVTKRLQSNLDLAKSMKVDGTPVFVVGESFIQGAVPVAAIADAVAQARKHAEK